MNRLEFHGTIFDIGIILLFGFLGCFLCFCQDEILLGASMWVFLVSIVMRLFAVPSKYLIPIYCIALVLFIIGLVYLFDTDTSDQVQWPS